MPNALRLIFAFGLLLAAGAAHAADPRPYAREFLASDVVRLVETLRKETAAESALAKGKSAEVLRKETAGAADASDFKLAGKLAAAAVTANPKDAANWLALARLAVRADDAQAAERYALRERGATAAYAAYERLTAPAQQAEALAILGDLFARREMLAPLARRLSGEPRPARRSRHRQDLRGSAGKARLPHRRLQGRQRFGLAANLLSFLRTARPQDRFRALCRDIGRGQRRRQRRGAADLRRGPEARRALRDRDSQGAPFDRRRIPAQGRRLRDLHPRPLAAGPFHRQELRAAAARPAGRAAGHRQHRQDRDRRLSRRRPQSAGGGHARRLPQADQRQPRGGDRQPGRRQDLERRARRRIRRRTRTS